MIKPNPKHNDYRAAHKVYVMTAGGYGATCVKWDYRGYEISLSSDGEDTAIWNDNNLIASFPNTDLDAIVAAKSFVDDLIDKQ